MRTASRVNPVSRRVLLLLPVAGAVLFLLANSRSRDFEIREVDITQAKPLLDAGAVVVDVRAADRFDHRHIPGALLLPLAVLRLGIPASFAFAKDTNIVVYCGDGLTIGPEGTSLLNQAGYVNAVNLRPGIEGWVAAGLPIEKSNG